MTEPQAYDPLRRLVEEDWTPYGVQCPDQAGSPRPQARRSPPPAMYMDPPPHLEAAEPAEP